MAETWASLNHGLTWREMNYKCDLCGKHKEIGGGLARVWPPIPVDIYSKWLRHSLLKLRLGYYKEYYIFDVCAKCRAKYEYNPNEKDYFFNVRKRTNK